MSPPAMATGDRPTSEPLDAREVRPRGLGWILAANIAIAVDYSMIMPTGWLYIQSMGGSEMFYGATIAAFPIGRMCFLLLVGHWSDRKGFKSPFLFANCLGIAGGLTYGVASSLGSKWFAMLGRFLGGCGATHPLSAWAARSYPAERRAQIEQFQKAAQLIGVVLGPALNAFVVNLNVEVGFLRLNPQTCAGYFPAILSAVLVVGFLYGVDEPTGMVLTTSSMDAKPWRRLISSGGWICLFIAFYTNLQMSALDTIIAPLTVQHLGWTLLQNSLMFAGLAIVSFAGAIVGLAAMKKGVRPLRIIIVGSFFNLLSAIGMDFALWSAPDVVNMHIFLVAGIVGVLALLSYGGSTGGLYQQACGDAQGLLGGLYSMAFAAGRPAGALLAGNLLNSRPMLLCIMPVACICFGLVSLFAHGSRLNRTEDEAIRNQRLVAEGSCENGEMVRRASSSSLRSYQEM